MNAKMMNKTKKPSVYLGISGIGCLAIAALNYAVDFRTRHCTEQIHSQAQLERIVQEERCKIGVSADEVITSTLEDLEKRMPLIPAYGERKNNKYFLHFDDNTGNSRGVVRHELCHLYYRDKPPASRKEWLHYLFIEEQRAMWCSLEF